MPGIVALAVRAGGSSLTWRLVFVLVCWLGSVVAYAALAGLCAGVGIFWGSVQRVSEGGCRSGRSIWVSCS